tara:strand:- start:79 stop:3564 length:3486 start_codon:yes stop_codon:yes gene_type:complete
MSELLLDRLGKKPAPKKQKAVEININKGQVQVETHIVDKTKETKFDINKFRQRIKSKGLTAPKISDIVQPETKQEISKDKPEKIKSKLKLPGKKLSSEEGKKHRRKRKPKPREEEIILDIPATLIEIDDRTIGDRLLPKAPDITIKAPAYYLNNREIFVNFINSLFRPYSKKINSDKTDISCDSKRSKNFELMIHQQIVRDYINIYSPYRGLLLYHGLGAGKTCASIAIAEGMKDHKEIIIMTPASLRMNYISELKHCGDPLYKLNQYWEKIYTNDNKHIEKALSEILGLEVPDIRKEGGAWLVDMKKDSNFDTLTPSEQKSIDKQLNKMIFKKYKFINYNGMREGHLENMIELSQEKHGTSNPFDNKVIVIDEAHNFVSRIVNKLKNKKSSLSTRLYELILKANNCRVVFLTGTPIINYPNEIAILFNMLRGYIKTFYLPLDTSETSMKINQKKIVSILSKDKLLDYVEYKSSNNTLAITRNPFGFISRENRKKKYMGVSNNTRAERDDDYFKNSIIKRLKQSNIKVIKQGIKINNHKALPDTLEAFNTLFIDQTTGAMKNINLFKRRILGLTSYFRSAQEALLPRYDEEKDTHIVKIPMSNYQIGVYEEARAAERKEELRNARKKKKQGGGEGIYGDTTSTYRIFSRAFCNFVFPREIDEETDELIKRPMPKEEDSLATAISTIKQKDKDVKGKKAQKKGQKSAKSDIKDPNPQPKRHLDEDFIDGADIQSRLDNVDGRFSSEDHDVLEAEMKEVVDTSYPARIKKSLELLKKNANKYFSPAGLKKLSPKFLNVLQNIQSDDHLGLHLIYSQFRTIEGIGILALILEHNGFARFNISKNSGGVWQIDMNTDDLGKPTFVLYTGTESAEEKEITRNIFNGTWSSLPTSLIKQLKQISKNNNMGEIIKVFMITSSGSEGITLRNTRYVHIIEPYWHPVRIEQVIGRARRICSHQSLEEEFKTVEVFLYLMTFTEHQLHGNPNGKTKEEKQPIVSIELKLKDRSKIDKSTPLTSDEALFEISRIKQNISKGLLTAIKESSVDCSIHSKSNSKENLVCYSFGKSSVGSFSFKPAYTTEEKDTVTKLNRRKITWKASSISIQGTKYAIKPTDPKGNKKLGEIYDLDSYKQARQHGTNPILIGRTQLNPKNNKKIQFIRVGDAKF